VGERLAVFGRDRYNPDAGCRLVCGARRDEANGGLMKVLALGLVAAMMTAGMACAQTDDPTGPQPKLPTETLTIIADSGKSYGFTVEMALTTQQQDTGLMFRTLVPADTGMLFPWPQPQMSEMWMKNTVVPLDMVFIGPDHTIKAIAENTVPYSLRAISSGVPVIATLELQGGITAADDINVGDKVISKQLGGS
jgi:uncharacterized membrane protein (UPF0127 family)